ncbi:hypothetical protein [Azospirillum argentinense]
MTPTAAQVNHGESFRHHSDAAPRALAAARAKLTALFSHP